MTQRRIDIEGVSQWLRLVDRLSNVDQADSGYTHVFTKNGELYLIDDAGVVTGPFGAGSGGVATDDIWDAAGDIVQGTGANTAARLAIGTAYQLPRVNSGATALEYVSAGRVLISEQTPTATGTVTWSSIPATWKSLEIEYMCDTDAAAVTSVSLRCYFNNDTTAANYRSTLHFAYGTNSNLVVGADTAAIVNVSASGSPANSGAAGFIKVISYTGTTYYKQARATFSYREDASSTHQVTGGGSIEWESTSAITRVDLVTVSGNYLAGSVFRLYGVF